MAVVVIVQPAIDSVSAAARVAEDQGEEYDEQDAGGEGQAEDEEPDEDLDDDERQLSEGVDHAGDDRFHVAVRLAVPNGFFADRAHGDRLALHFELLPRGACGRYGEPHDEVASTKTPNRLEKKVERVPEKGSTSTRINNSSGAKSVRRTHVASTSK